VGDPGEWSVRRIGRVTGGVNTAATIAATYLPGERPALLVATYEGDLVALDATSTAGDVLWRFSPGGTVFGQPAVDPESGRIYFGASDKRLYALDGRGLFLWSFPTGDNVATRPALHRGGVFFGSEDRNAYALDAETGALRWQRQLGNAVVGAPAVVAGPAGDTAVAVFGADDGAAYGLDAETGAQRWRYETGNAVEAPILPLDGRVLVTSTAGTLSALDPLSGEEGWVADNGRPIRHAPAIAQDRLIVVDEQGFLNAFDRTTGRRLWQSLETDYYGTPRLVGDTVLVAGSAAVVHRLGLDGRRRGAWAMSAASDASDGSVRLDFGPALGGGAAWLIDGRSVIRRIGPPLAGPQGLPLAWSVGTNEPPFALDLLRAAPVALPRPGGQSELLLLDEGGRMVSVEPATGRVALLARAPLEAVRIEPALTGDVLIAESPTGLHAVRLSDGAGLWDAAGGTTVQPPVVAGDLVLWSTALGGDPPAARLSGLDVKTGAPRWQRDFAGVSIAGGLLVQGEAVFYTSPVSRLDLATGATRWEAAELTGGSGAPALSAAGDTLYVGRIDPVAGGAFAALDAETGAVRWQVNLGNEALSLLERPWVLDDLVILPGLGGTLLALDAGNGNVRWRMGVGDGGLPAPRFGALTVADGRLYTALQDGQMVVLDGRRGEIVARRGDREGGLASYGYAQRPAVVDGFVVMTFGSVLRGFDLREVQP
jgi:outer membrane protein assembly factor BamB